ncbi:MAG: hypothetical protein L0Z62_37975 [Gemmataceae bacterium]|nr:hypothetical protein [Gemmataceae bacterium]
MLTELYGKQGCLCQPARAGELRCPLIIRPNGEDVITGHLALALRVLDPRRLLPDLLNAALGAARFRPQVFRRLRVEPWVNRPRYPRELLSWDEGSTQVDLHLTWENPPTTVYLEAKYGSDLAKRTARDDGSHGFPSDQLVRNARVGLLEAGYFGGGRLFPVVPRDFALIVLSPHGGHSLVARYRDPSRLREAIPHSDRLVGLPRPPFVGELTYDALLRVLQRQRRWWSRPERVLADALAAYLEFKLAQAPAVLGRPVAPMGTPSETFLASNEVG